MSKDTIQETVRDLHQFSYDDHATSKQDVACLVACVWRKRQSGAPKRFLSLMLHARVETFCIVHSI